MLILIGAMGGFFVVPMNALLQHRGHLLMGAGHSIAVQNFNENISILVMLGVYALMIRAGLEINAIIVLFGLLVAGVDVPAVAHPRPRSGLTGRYRRGVPSARPLRVRIGSELLACGLCDRWYTHDHDPHGHQREPSASSS